MKRILDVALTLLMGCLMAYSLVGEMAHEILGLAMTALLVLHHLLNGAFYRRLPRGRYTPYRAALTLLDALMLGVFLLQAVSGLMMARYVRLLPVSGADWARKAHLLGANWGFMLCGVHAGLHMTALPGRWRGLPNLVAKAGVGCCVLGTAAYGGLAFIRRGMPGYMTLRQQFVFFDFGEPIVYFFVDYAFILAFFMALGCVLGCALLRAGRPGRIKRD